MESNTTLNNISAISWWPVLLIEEIGENQRPTASHCQTLSHKVVSSTPPMNGIRIPYTMPPFTHSLITHV